MTTTDISKEFLTHSMEANIVAVTSKGQISLPVKVRRTLGIKEGDRILLVSEGDSVLLKRIGDEFKDLVHHAESVAQEFWSSKEDDAWDDV